MGLMVNQAMGIPSGAVNPKISESGIYVIWPLHLKAGTINCVEGLEKLKSIPGFLSISILYYPGDIIETWGSARQVYGYVHLKAVDMQTALNAMKDILATLRVMSASGNNLLTCLFGPYDTQSYPEFVKCRLS